MDNHVIGNNEYKQTRLLQLVAVLSTSLIQELTGILTLSSPSHVKQLPLYVALRIAVNFKSKASTTGGETVNLNMVKRKERRIQTEIKKKHVKGEEKKKEKEN